MAILSGFDFGTDGLEYRVNKIHFKRGNGGIITNKREGVRDGLEASIREAKSCKAVDTSTMSGRHEGRPNREEERTGAKEQKGAKYGTERKRTK